MWHHARLKATLPWQCSAHTVFIPGHSSKPSEQAVEREQTTCLGHCCATLAIQVEDPCRWGLCLFYLRWGCPFSQRSTMSWFCKMWASICTVWSSLDRSLDWIGWSCSWAFSFSGSGSAAHITDQHLKAAAVYPDDTMIRFVMKRDPSVGRLQLTDIDNPVEISVRGPVKSFTQADINKGKNDFR